MRFDWDLRKASANLEKHGIAFEDAITAFEDDDAFITADLKHSNESETRQWLIGRIDSGKVVAVVFTEREGQTRIISARTASRKERLIYEAYQRIPLS
jgi:uncharacterized protein